MSFYGQLAATSKKLLADKGRLLQFVHQTAGAYDANTATVPLTNVAGDYYGVVLDYPAKLIDGTNIQRGDKKLLAESGANPTLQTVVVVDGVRHRVVDAKPLSPAGTVVLHVCQIRAGG